MSVFPEFSDVEYSAPVGKSDEYKTLVQPTESGTETRKQKRTYPRRYRRIKYQNAVVAKAMVLYKFYNEHRGGFSSFVFFDRNATNEYVKEYVGTGDGSRTIWDLPSKNASDFTLYINDVAKTEGVDWTFSQGGGADGEDRCTYGSVLSDGDRITFSFKGRLKIRCVFKDDRFDYDEFYNALTTIGIILRGLLNT